MPYREDGALRVVDYARATRRGARRWMSAGRRGTTRSAHRHQRSGGTVNRLPILYIRGYAGPPTGIDAQVDDPFYGFNKGATHVRVGGSGEPAFYQFEGPMLRLMIDHQYQLLVKGTNTPIWRTARMAPSPRNRFGCTGFMTRPPQRSPRRPVARSSSGSGCSLTLDGTSL